MSKESFYYLSAKEVAQRYSIGISTVWDWASKKLLPPPIRYGQRCTRWSSADLDKHDQQAKGAWIMIISIDEKYRIAGYVHSNVSESADE